MRIFLIVMLTLSGCATEFDDRHKVFAPQTVIGWQDENGVIHMKGVGGDDGYAIYK